MVAEVNGPLAEHNSPLPLRLTSIGRLREGPHALGDVLASTRHGNLDSSFARNVGRYSGHIGPSQRAASFLRLQPIPARLNDAAHNGAALAYRNTLPSLRAPPLPKALGRFVLGHGERIA